MVCMGFLSKLFGQGSRLIGRKVAAKRNHVTCAVYSVRGKNPGTGRMKKVDVVVESTASVDDVQKRSGLLPPYEVERVDGSTYDGPTEKQLAYAKKVGINFPDDATSRDATIFLTRYEEERPLCQPATPDRFVRLLIDRGIVVPAYAGMLEVSNMYLNGVSLEERIAFFAMRVFCKLKGRQYCLLDDAPEAEREAFYRFAEEYQKDKVFVRSVYCYSGEDLPLDSCTISKRLKAYDIAADYFREIG